MQNIFLTGGTDGIGLSATKSLLAMNNRLFVTYRNEKKLAGVKSKLKPYVYDNQINFLKCDLSELSEIAEVVKAVTKSNIKIDCLINNAGTIVAIGAKGNDANGSSSGHVRVYQYSGGSNGSWTKLGSFLEYESPSQRAS